MLWKNTNYELKRLKLSKKLAVPKAEIEVVIKNEEDEIVGTESLPDEVDKNYVLQNYLSSVTNVGNLTMETNVESVGLVGPLEESPSNNGIPVVKNEPVTTPSKITATNTMEYLKVLDNPGENQRMVCKLPRYLINRWSREVDRSTSLRSNLIRRR